MSWAILICLNECFSLFRISFPWGFYWKMTNSSLSGKEKLPSIQLTFNKKVQTRFSLKIKWKWGTKKLKRFYRRYDNLYGHLFMIISYASHYSGFSFICCVFRCISNKVLHFFPGPTGRNCKKFPGPIQNFLHIWADDDVADR